MTNDEKLRDIGKEVLTTVFKNDKTNTEWEYFSAVCYGQRIGMYGGLPVHGFFELEKLEEPYEVKFKEKYPEQTEEEVWNTIIKEELIYCANKLTAKNEVLNIINKY